MSATCKCDHGKENYRVTHRKHNHSAFNGYHYTYSDYSTIMCIICGGHYRSKAAWVDDCPDLKQGEHPHQPDIQICKE